MNALGVFFESLHFLRPQWGWALLLLPLLGWSWLRRRRRRNVWRRTVDAHLLPHLLARGGKDTLAGMWLAALGYAIAVAALAGPSWRQEQQPLWQSRMPLVIALDLSSSIAAGDLPPSRLLQARAKLATLLRQRAGGEIALVAYAGEAYTVAPLTDDVANVALFLDALSPEVMPVPGQRADLAIDWAVRLLQQGNFKRGDILLLSDHADADAQRAAARAASLGYRVSALGLGTARGAAYRDAQGGIGQARLDAGSLRALAGAGGGGYAALAPTDTDLQALGVLRPQQQQDAATDGERSGRVWLDQGYWLLLPLLALALLAFRRHAGAAVLVLLLGPLAVPPPAHAQTAAPALGGDLWRRADQVRQQRLDAGVQAYRKGDYAAAQQQFEGIDSDQGWYNLGNALARQGRYDEAIAAYDKALKQHPDMADARANRAAVDAARKRQSSAKNDRPGQQNQGQQQQGSKGQPQSGSGQSPQGDKPGQPAQPPPSPSPQGQAPGQDKNPSSSSQSPPTQAPPKPGDAQSQQQADAAQRRQMQQAMAQQGAAGKPAAERAAAAAAETPQQREQRQAVEAWLRRVPDDPGNLLRAKFKLEHERRQREDP